MKDHTHILTTTMRMRTEKGSRYRTMLRNSTRLSREVEKARVPSPNPFSPTTALMLHHHLLLHNPSHRRHHRTTTIKAISKVTPDQNLRTIEIPLPRMLHLLRVYPREVQVAAKGRLRPLRCTTIQWPRTRQLQDLPKMIWPAVFYQMSL